MCAATVLALLTARAGLAETVTFELMVWTNDWTNLPTAVGLKPSYNNTNDDPYTTLDSDWLLFTPDDKWRSGYNHVGAFSHKFNDRVGLSGIAHGGYESANSLTGYVRMTFVEAAQDRWDVEVDDFYTEGWKTDAPQFSKSYLVTTNTLIVVTNADTRLDGLGNTGTWFSTPGQSWGLSFRVNSLADTPKPGIVNHTEVYPQCLGCIIPVSELTTAGLAQTVIDDPSGYATNDFEAYLLEEIAPRLPDDARYLLCVQFLKTHILYSSVPDHVNTNDTLFGECWIAHTRDEIIPEPVALGLASMVLVLNGAKRRRS